jgi:hypothetical protein
VTAGIPRRNALARAGGLLLLVVLAAYALFNAREDYAYQYAFDLYHPWGIRAAREAGDGRVNPYTDTARVGALVAERAEASSSLALHRAAVFWKIRNAQMRFEPTGTPFLYALFAFLPHDYDAAHLLFVVLQFAAVAAGVYLLGRQRGGRPLACLCLAAFVWATFNPFTQDVKFGNVNSMQFLAVAAFIAAAHGRAFDRSRALDMLYLPALVLFALAKPNTGLIVLALAAHYALSAGGQRLVRAAILSLVALVAGVLVGIGYLGDTHAWIDWYRYTQGMNGGTLLYTAREGNLSIVKMLSETGQAKLGVAGYSAAVALVLAAAMLLALSERGRAPRKILPGIVAVLEDPWLAASIAVLATFAVSPLMWPHYWVLALVPLMRFFRWHGRWDVASGCAVLAYALLSRPVLGAIYDPARAAAIYTFMMFSWTPLLVALIAELAVLRTGDAAGARFTLSDKPIGGVSKP